MKQEILNLKFFSGDLDKELTVRQFFYELLKTLFEEGEGFSGKRPFGNSGWDGDLIKCFIENKVINGSLDEDGYIKDFDRKEYNKALFKAIELLNY